MPSIGNKILEQSFILSAKLANIASELNLIQMKKFFLLPLFALFLGNFQLAAQSGCTPEEMLPDTVIVLPLPYQADFPERGIQDTACVGGYYETVIQVRIPETIAIGTTEVAISQVAITEAGITDLPASFDYVCDPPTCVFLPEEVGCIQLYGEATAADVGMHNLKINVLISTQFAQLPYTLPDGQLVPGNYFFNVRPEGSENCLVDATEVTENAFDLRIQPNPFSDLAEIFVDLPQGGKYELQVFNTLGTLVQQKSMDLVSGQNSFRFDGSSLATGMYIFRLQQGVQAASGRLLIQR
jgi:hypothetical protein